MEKTLDILRKVDFRGVWRHEAIGFTNWLPQRESFDLFGKEKDIREICGRV